jgi:cytochrome c biogenesis factor
MASQNFANHRQTVPVFHLFLLPILALTLIGSVVNLVKSWGDHQRIYSASLIVVLAAATLLLSLLCRMFALKAQDRAIRAEENLRHFVLTGKLLDPRLTIRQVIALRFASDGEFVALAKKAAEEGTAPDDIKRSIREWRADTYRV